MPEIAISLREIPNIIKWMETMYEPSMGSMFEPYYRRNITIEQSIYVNAYPIEIISDFEYAVLKYDYKHPVYERIGL